MWAGGSNSACHTRPHLRQVRLPDSRPHHLVVVHHEFQDHVQPGLPGRQQLLERLGLRHGPGEAVQQEPGLGVVVLEPVGDHGDRHLVGDQVAPLHERLRATA